MSNIFHDNVNVTITINAIIIRSITLFHCIYMVGINSFEIKKLRHWQLQKKLRLAVSVLCLIALSSNFTTFILRSSNSVSSLDTAVETCVTNFENVLDIFYNFCFNGCLLTLLICSLDRYKRIVLSDHEISVMKAQAALDQTLPRLKRRIWLNGFTALIITLFIIYDIGFASLKIYSIINTKETIPTVFSTILNGIIGLVIISCIILEYSLNIGMVICISRNISSHPRSCKQKQQQSSSKLTATMMSSNMSFSGEKSYDCGSLSPYGEVSTPDHHRVVQFSEIRCSTTRSSVDGRLRNNLLVQRLVQSFTSIENQLFVKIGSVLSLIFLTDLISLVLTTYFSFSADGLGILTLFIPSIITIHIHSSFYLFDYLLVCVNDIKQHIKNEIAAAAVLSTRMPATAARGGGGGGVGGGLLIPKEVRQNVNFSIRNESFFDESYSFQSFHIRSDQTETGISAKISYPIPPSNTDRQPIYIPPPI